MKVRRIDYSADEMIAGVAGQLDPEEFGVYWMVCTLIYSRGGPIPNDPVWIAGVFRKTNPRTVRAVLDRLTRNGKLHLTGAGLLESLPPGVYHVRIGPEEWSKIRRMVFQRDGHRCIHCGSDHLLECDHIVPISRGGTNELRNLVTSCRKCNRSKGAKPLHVWLDGRAA